MVIEDDVLTLFSPSLLGYCNCGCGKQTKYYKSKLNKYFHGHNLGSDINHHAWKGGIQKTGEYLAILAPNHPFRTKNGRILYHRYILEKHLSEKYGREIFILPYFDVHHIDGNPKNNDPTNLTYLHRRNHMAIHSRKDTSDRRCSRCGTAITYWDKGGWFVWHNDKKGGWRCQRCKNAMRYK